MKTYQIELKRVSYVNLTIEAESQDEAEALAWKGIEQDYYRDDGLWDIESIELDEPATDDSRSYGPHHQDENQFYGPSCRI
jgi:hypothetical protein